MSRLLVLVEGQTEEMFVKEILSPHLVAKGFHSVVPRIFGSARKRDHRGGVKGWDSTKKDIMRHLKEDPACFLTTLVDYYGMPKTAGDERAWPGRATASQKPKELRGAFIEEQMLADIRKSMPLGWNSKQFIPFVIMHEFEALLFSDCHKAAKAFGASHIANALHKIREQFRSPEDINDSVQTSPSHRILTLYPDYQKPIAGSLAILAIGLDHISHHCPHFRAWLQKIERLHSAK